MKNHSLVLLLVLFSIGTTLAQRSISGTITDESGEPLIGASVLIKGTTTGTVTDFNGSYQLNVPEGSKTLVYSYTGFAAQEITIGASNVMDVSLREGITLNEAVVTALGVTREEKSLGYSVQSVDGDDLSRARETNIVNSLSGRIAGVQVTGGSGNLGGSSRIVIRGVNSFLGENEPLFVVDGVPLDNSNFTTRDQARGGGGYDYGNAIQDLNPDDIETVNVLKGAAATALYGSRGANGVIMVTTKSGAGGSKKGIGVSVNSSVTFDDIFIYPDYQNKYGGGAGPHSIRPRGYDDNSGFYKVPYEEYDDEGNLIGSYSSFDLIPDYATDESLGPAFDQSAQQYLDAFTTNTAWDENTPRYAFPNGYGSEAGGPIMYRAWDSWDDSDPNNFGISRPWQASPNDVESFYETGVTWRNNIAFSGGDEKSNFRLSYTNLNQNGIFPNSELERNTLNFNGRLQMSEKLSAFVTANYLKADALGRPGTGYDSDNNVNVSQMFNQWFQRQLDFDRLENYKNPDGTQRTWNRRSATDPAPNFWDNPYWTRYENFQNDTRNRIFGNFGLRYDFTNWLSATARVTTDYYNERREERVAVNSLAMASYREDLFEVIETNFDLLLEANKQLNEDFSISGLAGVNLRSERVDINQAVTRDGLNVPGLYNLLNSTGTPLLNDEVRNKEVNGVFGSVSIGFQNFIYLDFKGRNDWSSTLPPDNASYFYPAVAGSLIFSELIDSKVLSFGKVRLSWAEVGNDTEPYRLYKTFAPLDNIGGSPSFSIPNRLPNIDLRPERTREVEAGVELAFFKNRLSLNASVYDRTTYDQIVPLGTSGATGYTSMVINAGEMQNKGVELALSARPVVGTFTWDVGVNFGANDNKVVELDESDPNVTNLPIINAPFAVTFNAYEGQPYGTILGYALLRDANGEPLVNPANGRYLRTSQVVPIGNVMPDFTGGVFNTFSWKGLSLNVLVDFQKGGDLFSLTNVWGKFSGLFEETAEGSIREDGVVPDGVAPVYDSEGNPVVVDAGDPDVVGDEVYESSGENTASIAASSHFLFNSGWRIGERDLYDASFVKLREVSLGYTFPSQKLSAMGINKLTLRLIGRNLALLYSNVPHIDPESAVSSNNIQGLEGGQNPSIRSVGFNLSFDF